MNNFFASPTNELQQPIGNCCHQSGIRTEPIANKDNKKHAKKRDRSSHGHFEQFYHGSNHGKRYGRG